MEKEVRKVVRSKKVDRDILEIYHYGKETFGDVVANVLLAEFSHTISGLSYLFNIYPECRHLATKSKIYRNAIIGRYLLKYRITPDRIEVLRALNGSIKISSIKKARGEKI